MNSSGVLDELVRKRNLHWRLKKGLRQLGRLQGTLYRNIDPALSAGRTMIFCTSYINDAERYRRWVDYFHPRREAFGAEQVFLINDGGEHADFDARIAVLDGQAALPERLPGDLVMVTFAERLGRVSMFCYPGWWRSFTFSVRLARHYGFDKIIHIESDAYVCSHRLADYIRRVNRGWTALWSKHYGFPETAIQIICRDAFPALEAYADRGTRFFFESERAAEYLLPFDKIETRFHGERCGVLDRQAGWRGYDYLAQVTPSWELHPDF